MTEHEGLLATRSGKGKTTSQLDVKYREKLGEGEYGTVHRVLIGVKAFFEGKAKVKTIPFAYKEFKHTSDLYLLEHVRKIHAFIKGLKSPSLKVVPTFRITERGVLMTDLTEGGKNLVISYNEFKLSMKSDYIKYLQHNKPNWVQILVNLNEIEIFNAINDIAKALRQYGISVHRDTLFLVFKPDQGFEVYLGDLDMVDIYDRKTTLPEQKLEQPLKIFCRDFDNFLIHLRSESKNSVL